MSERKYPISRPKAVDLFCGAGGMSLGFEQAGFDIVLGVDYDGHHVAAHERNFPYGKAVCMSVADLNAARVRELAGIECEIDLIFGGPPCQGFSNMGHRDKDDPRNTLVDEFARIVLEVKPKAFVMENVPALGSGDTKEILDRVVMDLENGGYRIVKPIRKLVASNFGVPQQRARLFVLGIRSDLDRTLAYPEGRLSGQPERPTVFEAIADLPDVEKHEGLFSRDDTAYDRPPRTPYARVARGVVDDPTDLSIPRIWDKKKCTGCMRTRHAPASVALYEATPPGESVPGHKLPRLDPQGLAPTLRAGSDSTRGSYTAPRPIHPFLPRCITAREAARLHGYPDWFAFFPTKWHAYKQIGNSVCPPVARAIGYEVMRALQVRRSSRSPKPLALGCSFNLPDNRPRQHRRIPQLREYPPVIEKLFDNAYDAASGLLRKPRFTFEDVQAAIAAVGANLKWTRADTFLNEIARSRNVLQILAVPLQHGFSILPAADGDWLGEFAPRELPGCIHHKEERGAKARDLSSAIELACPAELLRDLQSHLGKLLNEAGVRSRIWPATVHRVEPVSNTLPFACSGGNSNLRLIGSNGRVRHSLIILGTNANVPPVSRVLRLGKAAGCKEVIAVTPVTTRHLLVSRYNLSREVPAEVGRVVFALNGQH